MIAAILIVLVLVGVLVVGLSFAMKWRLQAKELIELNKVASDELAQTRNGLADLQKQHGRLQAEVSRLAKWATVADADATARDLLASAQATLAQAESDARILVTNAERAYDASLSDAKQERDRLTQQAQTALQVASSEAARIISDANVKAQTIAGEALDALRNANLIERTAKAMRNQIEGYGDEYLVPAVSLLDTLAEEFAHKDAGQQLKLARQHTKTLIKTDRAAACDYVESSRREGAGNFVLDAFNGKVDSVLSRAKHDNYGKLEQEINDDFSIVNYGGKAFRNARITEEYLAARLAELRWATITHELKRQEQEEQRRLREQIRDEEKARREYERAIKEAAREEDLLRRAMAEAQTQIDAATEEQRAQFETQLAELNAKLAEAEARNRRAVSLAQLTRRGHVYIISNVGSFGDSVYKIGLTRRLDPLDRIWELGDASVPFDFDVHAVILSDDAPALETQLHKHFVLNQINKVNHRKEFFRANLADIRREVDGMGIDSKWTMMSEAREYHETAAIEKRIGTDPVAKEAWINRQLTLDPVSYEENSQATDESEPADALAE